jgi:hypothetical protein
MAPFDFQGPLVEYVTVVKAVVKCAVTFVMGEGPFENLETVDAIKFSYQNLLEANGQV